MTHYIQSYYDGTLFEYSKSPQEGFVEHTNSKGKVSYRKYYRQGVEGSLVGVETRVNQYLNNREEVIFTLSNAGDEYKVTFPVLNNDGTQLDDFTESIVRHLPALQKGATYSINNWRMNKGDMVNGEKVLYNNSGVSFKQGGEKVAAVLGYNTDNNPNGEIPRIEWKELAGKNRPTAASKERKLEFLYTTLLEQVKRLSSGGGGGAPAQTYGNMPGPTTPEQAFINDEDDDLPF